MRPSVILSSLVLLGLSAGAAYGDSLGKDVSAPAEASPAATKTPALPPEPSAAPDTAEKKTPVTAIEPTVVSARAPAAKAGTADQASLAEPGPEVGSAPVENRPVPGKITRQYHSSSRVNRVAIVLPAGIRVTVRKDWYSAQVILEYPANPYTNWRGVTPDALAFNHTRTTLEVVPAGNWKYMPKELTVVVPSSVEVQVR